VVLIGSQNQEVELLLETELLIIGLITANVSVLYDVADFQHESPIRSTTVELSKNV
jgi:hypothetical protein